MKLFPTWLLRFRQLPRQEQRLLLQALCWLPVTHWGVRGVGFSRSCRLMARLSASGVEAQSPDQVWFAIQQSERVLAWAIRYGLHAGNCLSRALTLWWLLRQQGVVSELRIGVRRLAGAFEAHAWLEYRGRPLYEAEHVRQHYATFQAELFDRVGEAVLCNATKEHSFPQQ